MSKPHGAARAFAGRLGIALCAASVLMAGGVVAVNYVINVKLSSVPRVGLHTAIASSGAQNFLVVGSDSRAFTNGSKTAQQQFGTDQSNGGQRSDTMMVVRVDPDNHKTLVVSFPRDMWVNIPGVGGSKINAAYNDGPQKVIDTLRADYNIKINHFVQVDFKSFQGVVNAIGTVPVYVPYQSRDNLTGLYTPLPGCKSFTGSDALAYVRSRDLQYYSPTKGRWMAADAVPDINRIARQQQFIRQLAGIAVKRSLSNPITGNQILNKVLENLTIDSGLSKNDVLTLVDAFRTINPNDSGHVQFATMPPAQGPNKAGQSVLYLKEPDGDALLSRLGGVANPANVAIINPQGPSTSFDQPGGTTGGTTGTTTTSSVPTTVTTAPLTTTTLPSSSKGLAAPTPSIENRTDFGSAAPKTAPCT